MQSRLAEFEGSQGSGSGSERVVLAAEPAARASPGGVTAAVTGLFQSRKAETTELPQPPSQRPESREKLVIEGWVTLFAEDVPAAAAAIRNQVEGTGGRVTEEQVGGTAASAWQGRVKVRLPPAAVDGFLDWLAKQGEIMAKTIQATDVSRQFFDQEIALKNLELTLSRLQKLLEREGAKVEEVLRIEQELTRVRGEIERVKGSLRWLSDAVSFSTLEIRLSGKRPVSFAPNAKFWIGGRTSGLILSDPAGREQARPGGGAVVQFSRAFSIDLDLFPDPGTEGTALLLTLGGAAYTDFLGGGARRVLNPYLGLRTGYALLAHRNRFLVGVDLGVELVKHKYVVLELGVRALGLLGEDASDFVLQPGAGLTVPF